MQVKVRNLYNKMYQVKYSPAKLQILLASWFMIIIIPTNS